MRIRTLIVALLLATGGLACDKTIREVRTAPADRLAPGSHDAPPAVAQR